MKERIFAGGKVIQTWEKANLVVRITGEYITIIQEHREWFDRTRGKVPRKPFSDHLAQLLKRRPSNIGGYLKCLYNAGVFEHLRENGQQYLMRTKTIVRFVSDSDAESKVKVTLASTSPKVLPPKRKEKRHNHDNVKLDKMLVEIMDSVSVTRDQPGAAAESKDDEEIKGFLLSRMQQAFGDVPWPHGTIARLEIKFPDGRCIRQSVVFKPKS